jgi:hypothetical protein
MATITDEDRAAAHALCFFDHQAYCWRPEENLLERGHEPFCTRIAQAIADARERENKACEAETELRAVPLRDWFLRFVPGGVPSVPAELVQCAQSMLDRVEAIRDAIRTRRST